MTRRFKIFSLVTTASLAFAIALSPSFADEPEPLPEPPTTGAQEQPAEEPDEPQLEIDEPELEIDEGVDLNSALEKAVEAELGDAIKENSAEELLNLATDLKLSAQNLVDLTKVVSLCNKAEKLGLDEDNLEYAKQLRLSARLDRGLAIAQLFMNPDLNVDQLPDDWRHLRNSVIGDLTAALAENPDMPIANLALGRLYMLAERPEDAKKTLELAINSEDAEKEVKTLALVFRAVLESDANAAIPFVEQAIALEPEAQPRLYSQYSAYLQAVGRTDEALKQIDRAIELDPETPEYKKEKALLLAAIKRFDEARALFDEAIAGAQDNLTLQVEKGQFLASINDFDGAIAVYTGLIEKFDGPGLYFLRGALYAQTRDYEKALDDANQALRRDGNLLPAIRLKGIVFVQQERYEDAIRTFEQLKAKAKDDQGKLEATTQIAYAISKQGKYKRASAILKAELEKSPDNTDLLRSLADMELLFGHWAEATRLYEKLLEINPKDTGVLNNYSWLLGTCPDDQYRNAAKSLEYGKLAAEGTMYVVPHILSTLAAAYAENGDFESARAWAQKAVELGEQENHESLDSLKKELESYQQDKPWRETAEILKEVEDESAPQPAEAQPAEAQPAESQPAESQPAEEENQPADA